MDQSGPRILYSVPEAARQLSISRSTLFELLRRHELVGVKVASRRLLRHDDLVDYANRLRNENAAGPRLPAALMETSSGAADLQD
jgi:excisionase family DNA binding protein